MLRNRVLENVKPRLLPLIVATSLFSGCASTTAPGSYAPNLRSVPFTPYANGFALIPRERLSATPKLIASISSDAAKLQDTAPSFQTTVKQDRPPVNMGPSALLCVTIVLCPFVLAAYGITSAGNAIVYRDRTVTMDLPPAMRLSDEEQARLVKVLANQKSSNSLDLLLTESLSKKAVNLSDYPRLNVRLVLVEQNRYALGVSFTLVAFAQASPAPNVKWKETEHWIHLPIRRVSEWLEPDDKVMVTDLQKALSVLSEHIVSGYMDGMKNGPE